MSEPVAHVEQEEKEYKPLYSEAAAQVLGSGMQIRSAGIFERLIEEKSGSISGLKMIERVTMMYAGPPELLEQPDAVPTMAFETNLLVTLDGLPEGGVDFRIEVRRPSKSEPEPLPTVEIEGNPPLHRATVKGEISLVVATQDEGLVWFDLYVNDALIANVPLLVEIDDSLRSLSAPKDR